MTRELVVMCGDVALRARVIGARDVRSTVVLLHGLGDASPTWWECGLAQRLAAHHRVVALDARGHGGSTRPRDPRAYGADLLVQDVLATLDALEIERAHVVGYSLGGRTALELAARAPERVASLGIGGAHPFAQDMRAIRHVVERGGDAWLAVIAARAGALDPTCAARLRANDGAVLSAAARDREDVSTAVARWRGPALVWVGEHDPMRADVERGAGVIDARVVIAAGAEHFGASRAPDALDAVVTFLAGA
ncbi:alpha/beta fold hydrolase [Sandaracinus amylolyticus]|uniref:Alpha/beta hydrolase n=1 Tax=Sandaracinus amylolyticus TaxID=927083 RepID=A0A0F6VYZ1_9BACT|nr:alpha/beta hydrolase [Sandaracinus amylolyticus]AKF03027.1 Alpha/beta hydrolase [Sandaracinus amylolyticus]